MSVQGYQKGGRQHESKDVDVPGLLMIAALLLVGLGLSLLVCWGALHRLNRREAATEALSTRAVEADAKFPGPRLLTQPGREWQEKRAATERRLTTYGWVDRKNGVAHIPIEAAMKMLLARGLPEVGAGQTRLQLRQALPQTNSSPAPSVDSPAPGGTP